MPPVRMARYMVGTIGIILRRVVRYIEANPVIPVAIAKRIINLLDFTPVPSRTLNV